MALVHDDVFDIDVTPLRLLHRMIGGGVLSRAIYTACKLGLPELCADRPRTREELASTCGCDADAIGRYLRLLAAAGLFHEEAGRGFHLTSLGQPLQRDVPGSLWSLAVLAAELIEPAPADAVYAARTGRSAFDRAHRASLYEHLAGDPDLEALFAAAMSARAEHLHAAVVATVDWSAVRHVVDVGGNRGAFLAAILTHLPHATGVLFDQPQVVAGAAQSLAHAGVADRVDVEGGDFFVAVPPGGDLYLVANVLWNWSDAQAACILRRCRDAMGAAARLVVCEPVVPPGNDPHPAKVLDLANLWLNGGRVRTEPEWRALLAGAGFDLERVAETAMEWSVIEANPRP
jgi:hypothetical protein